MTFNSYRGLLFFRRKERQGSKLDFTPPFFSQAERESGVSITGLGGISAQDSENQHTQRVTFLVWEQEERDMAEAGKGSRLLSHAGVELLNREAHC